jgi:hypothetical protein
LIVVTLGALGALGVELGVQTHRFISEPLNKKRKRKAVLKKEKKGSADSYSCVF